jgi:hypothetical protein
LPKALAKHHALGVSLLALGLSAAFVSFAFFAPLAEGTSTSARVFTEGVNINLDRSSPAFAALEDTWSSDTPPENNSTAPLAVELSVGAVPVTYLAEKIMRANQREQSLITQERAARHASAQLMAKMAVATLRRMTFGFQAPHERVIPKTVAGAETSATKTISLSELNISREELLSSLFLPLAHSENDQQLQPPAAALAYAPARPRKTPAQDPSKRYRGSSQNSPNSNPQPDTGEYSERSSSSNLSTESVSLHPCASHPTRHQITVSGPLEFSDGLALANSMDRVVVFRQVDGEAVESGAVWLRQGRYELFAEENSGQIVGELRTPYGDVIGRGSFELSCIPVTQQNQPRISGIKLRIQPVPQGLGGRVHAKNQPLPGTEVVFRDLPFNSESGADGRFSQENLLEGSNAIVAVRRPGYWGTLGFARTGVDNQIELISNRDDQMVRYLMSAAMTRSGQSGGKQRAIIWGRVTQGGKPRQGARVELLTTASIIQPMYFNSAMMPDSNLTQTSANGMYAFFPVPQGAHAVQAVTDVDQVTESIVFPTEDRMISRMDIETAAVKQAKIKVFDAFATDRPLGAQLTSPGSNQFKEVEQTGIGAINYAENRSLLIIDADAGSRYRQTRIAINRDRGIIYIPMITNSWVDSMRGRFRVNTETGTGVVVGFVQGGSPYKIALEERSLLPSSRVIYFNSRGEPNDTDFGQPGGGFIIFNVPEGFRTITVQASGSSKIHSSVTLVESKVVSVISHWLR